jgi:hypothetical protein
MPRQIKWCGGITITTTESSCKKVTKRPTR